MTEKKRWDEEKLKQTKIVEHILTYVEKEFICL